MNQPPLPGVTTTFQPLNLMVEALRDAWLTREPIFVALYERRCVVPTVVGRVSAVAVTGAWVTVDGWHVPLDAIRAVHMPTTEQTREYAHRMHELREGVGHA